MGAIVEYEIVECWPYDKFLSLVRHKLREGFIPQGGVSIAADDSGSVQSYAQAFVKYAEKK